MNKLAKRLERIARDVLDEESSFDVEVSKGDKTFKITISRGNDGRWHEEVHGTNDFRPTNYASYLTREDILDWLRQDFEEVRIIDEDEEIDDNEDESEEMSKYELADELFDKLHSDDRPFRKSDAIPVLKKLGAKVNGGFRLVEDTYLKTYAINVTFNDETFDIYFDVDMMEGDDGKDWPNLALVGV